MNDLLKNLHQQFAQQYPLISDVWKLEGLDRQVVAEYFSRPASYMRPLLLLAGYQMGAKRHQTGEIEISSHIMALANCLERVHVCCLALDDYIDNATERRGGPALHIALEGAIKNSVLPQKYGDDLIESSNVAGWLVLNYAVKALAEMWDMLPNENEDTYKLVSNIPVYNDPLESKYIFSTIQSLLDLMKKRHLRRRSFKKSWNLQELYIVTLQDTLNGQLLDVRLSAERRIPSWTELHSLQKKKTTRYSILFPLQLGVILANPKVSVVMLQLIEQFSTYFGEAFQMYDDALVFHSSSKVGKSVLTDLHQGSATTVTLLAHQWFMEQKCEKEWNEFWLQKRTDPQAQEAFLEIIKASEIPTQIVSMITERLEKCLDFLERLRGLGYDVNELSAITTTMVNAMDDGRF